jgi:hypothetical protein
MSRKGRRAGLTVGLAVAVAAIGATVAIAASSASFVPKLGKPNGKSVHAGRITLTVKAPAGKTVYVWARPTKKLAHGHLDGCTNVAKGCLYAKMKQTKKGVFVYKALAVSFKGYWATTRGKYYWQAQSFAKSPPCQFVTNGNCAFYSKIGTFKVK